MDNTQKKIGITYKNEKRQEYVKIHLSGIKLRKLDGRRKIMEMLLYLVPVFGILGLLFAAYLAARVGRQDAGNDRMKEIAAAISDGAQAFLTAEYKILVIFVAVLFVLIGFGIGNCIIYRNRYL